MVVVSNINSLGKLYRKRDENMYKVIIIDDGVGQLIANRKLNWSEYGFTVKDVSQTRLKLWKV